MRFSLLPTLLAAAASATPLGNSTNEHGGSGKLIDSYRQSGLDFDSWIDVAVAEGRVFRPDNVELSLRLRDEGDSWTVKIKNVACSTVTGSKDLLDDAEAHFCDNFVKTAGGLLAQEVEMDVMRLLCDNGTFCKLGVKSVFDFFHLLPKAEDVSGACHDMFNAIQNACPAGGGVADTEVTLGSASQSGLLEFSYSLANDECVPEATRECFDKTIPQ